MLDRRFLATLLAVAALSVLNQVMVQGPLLRLSTDAPVINIAGRQRMLSQRLAKAALALDRAADANGKARQRAELERVLDLWVTSHEGLRLGSDALSLPGRNSAEVRAAFRDLAPSFERMRRAARRIVESQDRNPSRESVDQEDLNAILTNEADYLVRMDHIVGLYERETRVRIQRLRLTGWVVTGLILLVMLGLGRFVLAPASTLIHQQVAALREARDELEERVQERTAALEEARCRLEQEIRERRRAEERHSHLREQLGRASRTNTIGEMASGLAHELNQPLGAIANYTEGCLIALDAPEPRLDDVRDALQKSLATTLRAGRILKRIREFVTRSEPRRERIDPQRLMQDVLDICREEAQRRGVRLDLDLASGLPWIRGDNVQIQQVLVNLIQNAFEALARAEVLEPKVVVQARPRPEGGVEFLVSDNGEGIPGEQLSQIFDAFFSTRADGMGMGLAISRTIAEAHQGQITVESAPGQGTTFRFSIPLQVTMTSPPTVYIVDDDPDMRDSLRWLMTTVGLEVRTFASADDFLRHFRPDGPGCLVFDVRMPRTSGLDLYEDMVARGERMPVIFITAFADVPMAIRALRSGAVEFVEKPFNRQALLDRVQRAIRDDTERRQQIADRQTLDARFQSLTTKEWDVLEQIKEGHSNKLIAGRLGITPRAVEMRRSSLMKKLNAGSLAELLRLAITREMNAESSGNGR